MDITIIHIVIAAFGFVIWLLGAIHIHRRRKQGKVPFKDYSEYEDKWWDPPL